MLLIEKQNFTLASDRRLVKSSEVATVKSAAEIIAEAEAEAARIREEAKTAFEEEKKRGYEKGLRDGKLEIAMQKLEQVDQSVAFMESVEGKMADVVMKALRVCVEEIGDEEDFAFIHDGEIIIEADGIIQVIDLLGRVLVNRDANERITTNGLVGGVYVLRLINGENAKTQKIVVK